MPGTHAENQLVSRNFAQKTNPRRGRGRPRQFDAEVISAVEMLGANGLSATAIEARLHRRFAGRPLPAVRTIQQLLSDMEGVDPGTPWSVLGAHDDAEARVVVQVLAYVIALTRGARQALTQAEAAAVARVHACAPELEVHLLWTLAYLYLRRQQRGVSTVELDLLLATRPWRHGEAATQYAEFCEALGLEQFALGRQWRELMDDGSEPITAAIREGRAYFQQYDQEADRG